MRVHISAGASSVGLLRCHIRTSCICAGLAQVSAGRPPVPFVVVWIVGQDLLRQEIEVGDGCARGVRTRDGAGHLRAEE